MYGGDADEPEAVEKPSLVTEADRDMSSDGNVGSELLWYASNSCCCIVGLLAMKSNGAAETEAMARGTVNCGIQGRGALLERLISESTRA